MISMKNILLGLMMVLGVFSFSCKEDQLESIYIKRSGNLSITILDGEEPVKGQKVILYSGYSGDIMNAFETDEKGVINLGNLYEGAYEIGFEIEGYVYVDQEVQVISGGPTSKTIQVKDYVGTFTVDLYQRYVNEVLKEDHGYGIAIIPYTEDLDHVKEEDILDYAREIKYFDQGMVVFELPAYEYIVFLVKKDDEDFLQYVDERYIGRLDEKRSRAYVTID